MRSLKIYYLFVNQKSPIVVELKNTILSGKKRKACLDLKDQKAFSII